MPLSGMSGWCAGLYASFPGQTLSKMTGDLSQRPRSRTRYRTSAEQNLTGTRTAVVSINRRDAECSPTSIENKS